MKKLLLIPLLLFSLLLIGQDTSSISGKVIDTESSEPLPFVNIVIEKDGVQITGGVSDFDGNFLIKPIPVGVYILKASSVGFESISMKEVSIGLESTVPIIIKMESHEELFFSCCCCCCCYFIPAPIPDPIIDLFIEEDSLAAIMDTSLSSFDISEEAMPELTAFPNPSSGIFTLKNISESGKIMVMDMSGKTVKSMFAEKDEMVTINLSDHQPGTYILKYQEEGTMKVRRLVMY